jgi:hypothetical protein
MHTKLTYRYTSERDGKVWGEVICAGRYTKELEARIRASLFETEFFSAHEIGLPEIFPYLYDRPFHSAYDHSWHEFVYLEPTSAAPTDLQGRTIEQVVQAFERRGAQGWTPFDPLDRFPKLQAEAVMEDYQDQVDPDWLRAILEDEAPPPG